MVEHPDGHPLLLVALDVTHEARDRRVHGQDDPGLAGQLPEALGPRVVHPEATLEIDLAGVVATLEEELDRRLGGIAGGDAGRAESDRRHGPSVPSDPGSTFSPWPSDLPASSFSSSTSISGSPTSGARPAASTSGISTSSPPFFAPPTARATATPSPRTHQAPSAVTTGTRSRRGSLLLSRIRS